MNRQEIFDTVANHLLTQKEQSMDENGKCLYRGPNGLKCAIGCLIPDEDYSPTMEGIRISALIDKFRDLPHYFYDYVVFLEKLQEIHDYVKVKQWKDDLIIFAQKNHLLINFD